MSAVIPCGNVAALDVTDDRTECERGWRGDSPAPTNGYELSVVSASLMHVRARVATTRGCLLFIEACDGSGSIALIRFLNLQPFDHLSCWLTPQILDGPLWRSFAAPATLSYVCSTLRPVIPDAIVLRHVWLELADCRRCLRIFEWRL